MSIIREEVKANGNIFIKTYSDSGMYIKRDGNKYIDALDPEDVADERIYTETEELIPSVNTEE